MTWGIQNSFSAQIQRDRLSISSVPSSDNSIRKYWLRTTGKFQKSIQKSGLDNTVDHFRSPKMARVEAALFISDSSVSPKKLVQLATLADHKEAVEIINLLNRSYEEMGSAFQIERVATGYRMLTVPKVVSWLDRLHHRQSELKLSVSAMETLTIISYRQPVTRADIEVVRGVQCSEVLKQLLEKGLIRVAGEEDTLGRPYLYDTTRKFLELFGLKTLQDLPMAGQLRNPSSKIFKGKGAVLPDQAEKNKSEQPVNEDVDSDANEKTQTEVIDEVA